MSIIGVNEVSKADYPLIVSREDFLSAFNEGDIVHLLENMFGETGDSVYVFNKCGADNEIIQTARFKIDPANKSRIYDTWNFKPIVGQRIIIQNPADANKGIYEVVSLVDDAPTIFDSIKPLSSSMAIADTQRYIRVEVDDYGELEIDVTNGVGAGSYLLSLFATNINNALYLYGQSLFPVVNLASSVSVITDDDGLFRFRFIGSRTAGSARGITFTAPVAHPTSDGTTWLFGIETYPYAVAPIKSGRTDIPFPNVPVLDQQAFVVNPKLISVGDVAAIRDEVRNSFHKDLKKIIYSGADFNTIIDESLSYIKKEFGAEFNNFVASDLGIMFLDMFAYVFDAFSFNQDFLAGENYMPTLQLPAHASILARGLGYLVKGAAAATGTINITIMASGNMPPHTGHIPPQSFIIGKGSQIESAGRVFSLTSDVVISGITSAQTSYTFEAGVFEGQILNKSQKGTGEKNQYVNVDVEKGKYLASNIGFNDVTVGGNVYQALDFLTFDSDKQNGFETTYQTDPPQIIFGDGVAGTIPTDGADIIVNYAVTSGKVGNASMEGTIASFGKIIYKDAKGEIASSALINIIKTDYMINDIVVQFISVVGGGADPESLESVKINAPKAFSTAQRAVTSDDFNYFVNNYSPGVKGVAVPVRGLEEGGEISDKVYEFIEYPIAQFWATFGYAQNSSTPLALFTEPSQREELRRILNDFKAQLEAIVNESGKVNHVSVYVVATDSTGRYVSPADETMSGMEEFLNGKKSINTTLSVLDGIEFLIRVNVELKLRVKKLYKKEEVLNNVIIALTAVVEGKNFGDDLFLSTMYDIAKKVDGVDDIFINLLPYKLTSLVAYGDWNTANPNIIRGPEAWYDILFQYATSHLYFIVNTDNNYGAYDIRQNESLINMVFGYDTDGFHKTQITLGTTNAIESVRNYTSALNMNGSYFVAWSADLTGTAKANSTVQLESEADVNWTSAITTGDLFVINNPVFKNNWIYKVASVTYTDIGGGIYRSRINLDTTLDLSKNVTFGALKDSSETGMSISKVTWDTSYSKLSGICNVDYPNVDEIQGDFDWYFSYDETQANIRIAISGLGNSYFINPATSSHVIEGDASWYAVFSTKDEDKTWNLEILKGTDNSVDISGIYRIQVDASGNPIVQLVLTDAVNGIYKTRITVDKKWNAITKSWENITAGQFSGSANNLSCNFVMFGEPFVFFISQEKYSSQGNVGTYPILSARQYVGKTVFTLGKDLNGYDSSGAPLSGMNFKCFLIKRNDENKDTEGNIIAGDVKNNIFELITLGDFKTEYLTKEI